MTLNYQPTPSTLSRSYGNFEKGAVPALNQLENVDYAFFTLPFHTNGAEMLECFPYSLRSSESFCSITPCLVFQQQQIRQFSLCQVLPHWFQCIWIAQTQEIQPVLNQALRKSYSVRLGRECHRYF